jgi:Cytochrome c oxidase subunit IIa family
MDGNEHPKGALLFILIFLLLVVVFWINTYMRLWLRH